MSNDSKLQNYNTVMIMQDENPSDIRAKKRIPVHLQTLDFQQKDLFWAFAKGDTNYIYPFDSETLKKREHFVGKVFQLGLTGVITLGAANYLFMKQIKPQTGYSAVLKFSLFFVSNIIPLTIVSYQGFQLYNSTNNFLYEKYLKNNIEFYKNEREKMYA